MKQYILTHCAAEQNYIPDVFLTLQEAKNELKEIYNTNIKNEDYMDCISSIELYDTKLEIVYNDEAYDMYQIFEVDVPFVERIGLNYIF